MANFTLWFFYAYAGLSVFVTALNGLSATTWNRLEETSPRLEHALRLLQALGTDLLASSKRMYGVFSGKPLGGAAGRPTLPPPGSNGLDPTPPKGSIPPPNAS